MCLNYPHIPCPHCMQGHSGSSLPLRDHQLLGRLQHLASFKCILLHVSSVHVKAIRLLWMIHCPKIISPTTSQNICIRKTWPLLTTFCRDSRKVVNAEAKNLTGRQPSYVAPRTFPEDVPTTHFEQVPADRNRSLFATLAREICNESVVTKQEH